MPGSSLGGSVSPITIPAGHPHADSLVDDARRAREQIGFLATSAPPSRCSTIKIRASA